MGSEFVKNVDLDYQVYFGRLDNMTRCWTCGTKTNRFSIDCKFNQRKGYCKSQEKICQICGKKVGKVRLIAFFYGPLTCMDCRDKFFEE